MEEIWKDIDIYEGFYQVSSLGRIRSTGRKVEAIDGRTLNIKPRILKQRINGSGYPAISITFNKKVYKHLVHRLVAQHFVENDRGLVEVNHLDGNRENARCDNLVWVTKSENTYHKLEVLNHYGSKHGIPRGVYYNKKGGVYHSSISYRKKAQFLGTFKIKAEAYKAFYDKFVELRGHEPWDLKEHKTH